MAGYKLRGPLALALCGLAAAAPRDVVSFDFGWRHMLGLRAEGAPTSGVWPLPSNEGPGDKPAMCTVEFNDSHWDRVQLPHDGLIAQGADNVTCPSGCSGRSYIPRIQMWYRKTFAVPSDWEGSQIWIEFDGVFRATVVYLNGKEIARNANGYIGFEVSLTGQNATGMLLRGGQPNVLAMFVDPDTGAGFSNSKRTGWWYEGGGIYRHARLVRAADLHFASDGIVARSNISFAADGSAVSATLAVEATVANSGAAAVASGGVSVVFDVLEPVTGAVVGTATAHLPSGADSTANIPPGGSALLIAQLTIITPSLWRTRTPALYTVAAKLQLAAGGTHTLPPPSQSIHSLQTQPPTHVIDAVNVTHGFREIRFSGAGGGVPSCALNREAFKWRGFCDHDNFAVVGMAVPDRIKLFRAQMGRAVGGNSRRTSHNPPDPVMLDVYDRLGVLVMDETRIFNSAPASVSAMRALVERDRNHPSVAMWSFCNEAACEPARGHPNATEPQAGAPLFRAASKAADPTRPTSANTPGWSGHYPPFIPTDELTRSIDVQGFSHAGAGTPAAFHAMPAYARKPVFGSECCSCNTMRDEDVGCESSNGQAVCVQKSFAADCAQAQTSVYDLPAWTVGTMVWTLFDYYGEPSGGWPYAISSYGQFDLAGFPKAQAYWYRARWLLRVPDASAGKPFPTRTGGVSRGSRGGTGGGREVTGEGEGGGGGEGGGMSASASGSMSMVHIVESWQKPGPVPPPSNWPVPARCDLAAFQAACYPKNASATQTPGHCMDCARDHAAQMSQWHCDGPGVWDTLCATGGVHSPPPPPPPHPPAPTGAKNVSVYSDARSVELLVNGVSHGRRDLPAQGRGQGQEGEGQGGRDWQPPAPPAQSWAEWVNVTWAAGNVTVVARDAAGRVVAAGTRWTTGEPSSLALSVDAPAAASGTGGALLADGQDAALVRASVLDAAGRVCHDASDTVTFAVVGGPGRLVGAHNGHVASHGRNDGAAVRAYHGLARAVVRVTSTAGRPAAERALLAAIDRNAAHAHAGDGAGVGAGAGSAQRQGQEQVEPIVIEARVPGLPAARVSIAVSTNAATDSVLSVAAAAAGMPVSF